MLVITVNDHWTDGKRIHIIGNLTASGSYITGGDTLSFANSENKSASAPTHIDIDGTTVYKYNMVYGTSLSNGKLKIFSITSGVEISAGAYPAGVIADLINFHGIFPKFI